MSSPPVSETPEKTRAAATSVCLFFKSPTHNQTHTFVIRRRRSVAVNPAAKGATTVTSRGCRGIGEVTPVQPSTHIDDGHHHTINRFQWFLGSFCCCYFFLVLALNWNCCVVVVVVVVWWRRRRRLFRIMHCAPSPSCLWVSQANERAIQQAKQPTNQHTGKINFRAAT